MPDLMTIQAPPSGLYFSTTTGASVNLGPDEIRDVIPFIAMQAQKHGANILYNHKPAPAPAADDVLTPKGESEVFDAVSTLVEEGDPSKFTKANRPTVAAVQELTGFPVTSAMVEDAFNSVMDAQQV